MKTSTYRFLSFFILPVALFLVGVLYITITGPFFLRSVDPEYGYLINGLLIADLKLKLSFFQHPGTPMQCIAALVIRIVHIFRPENSLIHDVMLYPELYIKAILLSVISLNSIALYFLGFLAYKESKNWVMSIFLQITPFTHVLILSVFGRLMPEPLMSILICGWIILILKLMLVNSGQVNFKRHTLLFGLLFGLSLADKLTFLPFIFIPMLLLPGWKHKLAFMLYSAGFFLLFAFPITLEFNQFYIWVKNIFIHTGSYGSGDIGFLKWIEFREHLRLQFANTVLLKWVFLILILVTIIYIVRKKSGIYTPLKFRTAIALILVIASEYLMTSKHFAFHYMIPAILLVAFSLVVILLLLNDILSGILKRLVGNGVLTVLGLFILTNTAFRLVKETRQIQSIVGPISTSYTQLEPLLKRSPKIVSASYYGCDAIEYALTFGIHLSGRYSQFLTDNLKELYPETFIYMPWGKVLYKGNKEIQPSAFIKPGIVFNLYVADYTKEGLEEIIEVITKTDSGKYKCTISPVYVDSLQKKGVFKAEFSRSP